MVYPHSRRRLTPLAAMVLFCQTAGAQVVRVAPIVTQVPTPDADARFSGAQPPASESEVDIGNAFFVELWATNTAAPQTGLACVYVDLNYDRTDLINAVEPAQTSALFPVDPVLPEYDDAAGLVATTGGCQAIPPIESLGVDEWVLVKRIEMSPISEGGPITLTLTDSGDVIAATSIIGELNPVSPDDIDFQSRSFHIGEPVAVPVPTTTPSGFVALSLVMFGAGCVALPDRRPTIA